MHRQYTLTVEQQLIQTQTELENLFQDLKNVRLTHLSSSESAQIINQIFAKSSSPVIGAKLIKQQLQLLKWPFLPQFQFIVDKAELVYIQSIIHDLNRLKNQEKITYFHVEDVKQSIDQMNWKLAVDKESILNESQEIGQNMDIMKFFEGVRNYQNWQEQLQKKSIQKLISYANQVQNQLTLKKGYQITKIVNCLQKLNLSNLKEIFQIQRVRQNKYKGSLAISKILRGVLREKFNRIQQFSKKKQPHDFVKELINKYLNQKGLSLLLPWARYTKQKNIKLFIFIKAVSKFFANQKKIASKKMFAILNNRPFRKAAYSYELIQKIISASKKCAFVSLCRGLKLDKKLACNKIINTLVKVQQDLFKELSQKSEAIKNSKPILSDKIKGKILISLEKHSSKPINIRKTFLNWYLKSQERKYSKEIYNIWLHGNISKFTFFMRLKNLVDETRQYKIRYELKQFLRILCDKLGKYYHYHQAGYFKKWQKGVKRIKTVEDNKKMAKKMLIAYIEKIQQQQLKKKQIIFQKFKQNLTAGKDKKLRACTKAFYQDQLYKQKFLDRWRAQHKLSLIYDEETNKSKWEKKKQSLREIVSIIYMKEKVDSQRTIGYFLKHSNYKAKRNIEAKNYFVNFLTRNQRENKQKCFSCFVEDWKIGNSKKNHLVTTLVHANVMQQSRGLNLWKNNALSMNKVDKLQKIRIFYERLDQITKKNNFRFFKDRFISKCLNKIITNKARNMQTVLKKFIAIPLRPNWDYRKSLVSFVQKVSFMAHQNKNQVFQKFFRDHLEGKFRKKKIMDIMGYKYFDVSKKFFNRYRANVKQAKVYERSKKISILFEQNQNITVSFFKLLFLSQKEWVKKAKYIQKLNVWVADKKLQAFKLWREGAKAITYFTKIKNEKKSRCLQILTKSLIHNQGIETQKAIKKFKRNAQVIQIQKNLMNRLLDTQIGKTFHVLSIWKSLPPLKNRNLIATACKFQKRLQNIVQKRLKFSLSQFQEKHYIGNDKKRIVVRKLVSQYTVQINSYFKRWHQQKNLTVIFQKCTRVRNLFQTSQQNAIKSFAYLFKNGSQSKLIQKTLTIMVQRWQKAQRISLMNWFRFANEQKYKDFIKRNSLKNIDYLIKQNQSAKRQQNLVLFLKKVKLGTIVHKFIDKYYLKGRKQSLGHAIKAIKQLPDLKQYRKNQQRKAYILRCVENAQRQKKLNAKEMFEKFRHNRYRGEFKKQKAFSSYLNHKIGEASEVLHVWNTLLKEQKRNKKNEAISSNFHLFQEVVRSCFQHILGNRRQFQIKTKVIERLLRTQEIKIKGFIHLWQTHAKEIKILTQLRNKDKAIVLEKIARLLDSSSQQGAKKVIKNFHHHFKVVQVQKKFINRLLQTKSGKVVQAFQVWKDIPNQNLMQKYKKGQKFYFKLEILLKKRMIQTQKFFRNEYDEGNNFKKKSILQIFDATSSGTRKLYARWSMLTKRSKTVQTVKQTMRYFEIVQQCNQSQWLLLFEDQRSTKIKMKAIEKLIANFSMSTKLYFNIWRSKVQQYKNWQDSQNKQKKLALVFFNRVAEKSENQQTVDIIKKFRMNFKMKKIAGSFFERLLNTKTGKIIKLIEKWKSIPDVKFARKKKNAIIFESRLNKFYLKGLRGCLQPFKNLSYSATNKKRQCIERLIRLCQSDSRTKFDAWRNINRQAKILKNQQIFAKSFQACNNIYVDMFKMLTQNAKRQTDKKHNICRKMIKNANFVVHHAYFIWKQAYQIDNIIIAKQQSKVKINLKNLMQVVKQNQNKETMRAINQFRSNLGVLHRLKEKQANQVSSSKYFEFYQKINSVVIRQTGFFFNTLKESILQEDIVDRMRSLQTCFQAFAQIQQNNWAMVMKPSRQSKIMERAIEKIFDNYSYNTRRALNIWRQNKNILNMQNCMANQKKKDLLIILKRVVDSKEGKQIPTVIQQFKINFRIKKLQRQILSKILNTKAAKVPLVFMTWKNIPNPDAKKAKQTAMKFEAGLTKFYRKQVKLTFESFRDQSNEASIRKKAAVRKLILVTMSDSNRIFNRWRKAANQTKITSMVRKIDDSTNIMNERLRQFFGLIFDDTKQELTIKQQAIKRIVKQNSEAMASSLKIWKSNLQQQRAYLFEKLVDNFRPIKFNQKLLRSGFQAIRRKCQIENLRGYINSLWKWKSSNMQANYYSKFIKVFRESQQLLNFSNLFNRKYNEHLHYSFRMIASEGQFRTETKKRIVQKYLTKKLRYYFCSFKQNSLKKETQIWRERFTHNIKVNLLSDVLSKVLRRKQNSFFYEFLRHDKYRTSFERLDGIIEKFKRKQLLHSFTRIHTNGYQKILEKIKQAKQRSQYRCLKEVLTILNLNSKLKKFEEILANYSRKYLLRVSFSQVRRVAEKNSTKKMSLTLLNQLYRQKQKAEMFRIMNLFKKRKQVQVTLNKLSQIFTRKENQAAKELFIIGKRVRQTEMLLKRFSKGLKIRKIIDKQDKKLLSEYFERLKNKHNPWLQLSIRRFAAKSSLKSSMAVSLWRLKNLTEIRN